MSRKCIAAALRGRLAVDPFEILIRSDRLG